MSFNIGDTVICTAPVGSLEKNEFYTVEHVYYPNVSEKSPENTRLKLKGIDAEYYAYRFKKAPESVKNEWLDTSSLPVVDRNEYVDENGQKLPNFHLNRLRENAELAYDECAEAMMAWPVFNSAHEGFAILKEEVDELWEHVKVNPRNRDMAGMRKEALQVAAMALRFITDVCDLNKTT